MAMGMFQELKVWQRAKDLAVFLYRLTEEGASAKDYGLRDHIGRAAVSISSNIAEGDELNTDRQAIEFFFTAKGSSAEVLTQVVTAYEIGYSAKEHLDYVKKECRSISSMLTRLIQAISAALSKAN